MKNWLNWSKEELAEQLWVTEPRIRQIFRNSRHMEEARHLFFDYLNRLERDLFNMRSDTYFVNLNIVEKRNAKECIRVLSNTMRSENEYVTHFSPMQILYDLAQGKKEALDQVSEAFLCEYLALFLGITGKGGKHLKRKEVFQMKDGREAALARSKQLDDYACNIRRHFRRYRTGYDKPLLRERKNLKRDILSFFNATEQDWQDYRWHLRHVIKDLETIRALVKLDKGEAAGLASAKKNNIPFEITPYYLSLFHKEGRSDYDRAIRAQVIPSTLYCEQVAESRRKGIDMDFMGEKSTSPIDGITRRYPEILILKPYNSCPQICVYCQRNWEIKGMDDTVMMARKKVKEALRWIDENESISEVLITGGDPLTLGNDYLDWLIGEVAAIQHIERIRIGTRIPVTLPFRIDEGLLDVFRKYHEWGKREIAIVTHFEHPTEMTPDSLECIRKIKSVGMNVYNQQVFTYYNSRRYETALLRQNAQALRRGPLLFLQHEGKGRDHRFSRPHRTDGAGTARGGPASARAGADRRARFQRPEAREGQPAGLAGSRDRQYPSRRPADVPVFFLGSPSRHGPGLPAHRRVHLRLPQAAGRRRRKCERL